MLWVCVCLYFCLSYAACEARLFCSALYCHVWPVWLYHIFYALAHKRHDFRKKKLLNIKYVLLQLLSETFHILRRIQRDIIMNVHRYSCKVPLFLTDFNETWFFWQIFEKSSNIMFHQNPSNGNRVVPCGQTDMTKLVVVFLNFANAPKI